MPKTSISSKVTILSRFQLELMIRCPRCFWLLKRHGVKQPSSYPLALNNAMDRLLKEEFDLYRAQGKPHPLLTEHQVDAALFDDLETLTTWRNNRAGVRWQDPESGYTLFGAVDDILKLPDGKLVVLDYKSSGAVAPTVYPSYEFQLEVYTFLLEKLGYPTADYGYIAFYMANKEDGFQGRLPFEGILVKVPLHPERVEEIFREAIALTQQDVMPAPGEECDLCRWFGEADEVAAEKT